MKKGNILLIVLISVIVFGSVGFVLFRKTSGKVPPAASTLTPIGNSEEPLLTGDWVWERTDLIGGKVVRTDSKKSFRISFLSDNSVSVKTDCNGGGGTFMVDGTSVRFGPLSATEMYCEGSQDSVFFNQLQNVEGFYLDKDILFLILADEGKMTFSKMTGGKYVNYSKNSLKDLRGTKNILFFYASWCPTCVPADEDIIKNVGNYQGELNIVRVNYNDPQTDDEEKALAKKYNIIYQHTFVQIDENGSPISRWNGGGFSQILENLK